MKLNYRTCVLILIFMSLPSMLRAQPSLFENNPGGGLTGMSVEAKDIIKLDARFTAPAANRPAILFISAEIKKGWHIYSITQASGGPIPTKIQLTQSPQYGLLGEFQSLSPPKKGTEPEAFGDLVIESHEDSATWYAPLEIAAGVNPSNLRIDGKITVQPCDANTCLPPQQIPFTAVQGEGIEIAGEKTATGISEKQTTIIQSPNSSNSYWIILGSAFLGGLILNLMPCVLPVISLKIFSFLQQAGESHARVFVLNLCYSLGLLSVFMILAALAATAGLAWGEQFTLPWFKVAMTAVVFIMALSFLGVWEIPIPGFMGTGKASELQAREGPSGAFFKGAFATVLATPCSGPFLGPVFGYLLRQPPYMAYWVFGAVGLGMASPYLLIGVFPKLLCFLPKPGAWMETVKELMAFLLLATVVYLFTTLSSAYFVPTLALLVGLWFACWWIGRTPLTTAMHRRATAWLGGSFAAALVGWFAFTVLFQQSIIAWQPFSPQALAQAKAEGKTVMVDFSADWCLTCKSNLKFAIETKAVQNLIASNGVVPMLADWTDESPTIKKALNDLGYNSIPVLAIWPANPRGKDVIVLSDLLSENQVLEALEAAGPSKRE
jgi:thiol:disulfide interchange protein